MSEASTTSGDWDLYGFDAKLDRWIEETHPPGYVETAVRAWWPSLRHYPRTLGMTIRGRPGIRFSWVPMCGLPDVGDGPRGVQCHYRVFDDGRLVCQMFVAAVRDGWHEPDPWSRDA